MKQFIIAFIHNWSPWYLRKRVAGLENDFARFSKDMHAEDTLHLEKFQQVVKENERLTAALASANTEIVGLASKINNIVFSLRGATNDLDTVLRCMFTLINRHTNNKGDQQ